MWVVVIRQKSISQDRLSVGTGFALKSGIGSVPRNAASYFDPVTTLEGYPLVKPNYNFAKRQRELAKKAKKEEKQQRKAAGHGDAAADPDAPESAEGEDPVPPVPPAA